MVVHLPAVVVVGSATPPAANEFDVAVVNVSALAVPLSLSLTISF